MTTQPLSELRIRKLARLFQVYDTNHDGVLEFDDYQRLAASLAAVRGSQPGSAAYEAIRTAYVNVWQRLLAANVVRDGKVSKAGLDGRLRGRSDLGRCLSEDGGRSGPPGHRRGR